MALAVLDVQALFAREADERLRHLDELLLRLETTGDDAELVGSVFRELHTLKGSAGVAGLTEVSREAHELEDLVDRLRSGHDSATPAVIDRLLGGVDRSARARARRARGRAPARVRSRHPTPSRPPPTTAPAGTGRAAAGAAPNDRTRTVMVSTERLDELVRLVGESATANLRLGRMLKERVGLDPASCPEFNDVARTVNELQDRTMRTRMVPVSTITDQLQRAVRDLARTQGKEIDWEVRGGDTELDRSVLAQLTDSLVQLVRNAVDHGIETPAERVAAGKPARARISLHAMQLGSEVTVAVTDDGRGIDAEAVRDQARRQGVDTDGLVEEDLLALIFRPGLVDDLLRHRHLRPRRRAGRRARARRRRARSRRGALPGRAGGRVPDRRAGHARRAALPARRSRRDAFRAAVPPRAAFAAGSGRGPRGRRGPDARRDRRSPRTRVRPRRDPRLGRAVVQDGRTRGARRHRPPARLPGRSARRPARRRAQGPQPPAAAPARGGGCERGAGRHDPDRPRPTWPHPASPARHSAADRTARGRRRSGRNPPSDPRRR